MDYKLKAEDLDHPLLKKILELLIPIFNGMKLKYFVIGATARDIIMKLHNEAPSRKTLDIDFAIAIDNWEEYGMIEKEIERLPGFKKDKEQSQRFRFNEIFVVDIIPFGKVAQMDDKIYWPPDESFAMSVLGFEEAEKEKISVQIEDLRINVASLTGIFLLKLAAWKDRHLLNNKDADDMGFILTNYLNIHLNRAIEKHYNEVYDMHDFTLAKGGAFLMGIDLRQMLSTNPKSLAAYRKIIKTELDADYRSYLFNQIIETNRNLKFDEIKECFELIFNQLNIEA